MLTNITVMHLLIFIYKHLIMRKPNYWFTCLYFHNDKVTKMYTSSLFKSCLRFLFFWEFTPAPPLSVYKSSFGIETSLQAASEDMCYRKHSGPRTALISLSQWSPLFSMPRSLRGRSSRSPRCSSLFPSTLTCTTACRTSKEQKAVSTAVDYTDVLTFNSVCKSKLVSHHFFLFSLLLIDMHS